MLYEFGRMGGVEYFVRVYGSSSTLLKIVLFPKEI